MTDFAVLYDQTRAELESGDKFKKHGLHSQMKPVDQMSNDVPAVYLAHDKVIGKDTIYNDGGIQKEEHLVMFILVCDERDLTPCRRELARIYRGFLYKEEGTDNVFTSLQFKHGERANLHNGLVTWYEVYGNSIIGGC